VTYFVASLTMPDSQSSDMRRNDVSASSGVSSHQQAVNSIPKQSSGRCKHFLDFK